MAISLDADPIALYQEWADLATRSQDLKEPTACALATVDAQGMPSVRMVLLKAVSKAGFVFYTNLNSRKAQDLLANPKVSFCQHWMPLERQVRVSGVVEAVSETEADTYFESRDRMSRIGAWASKQSDNMESRFDLEKNVVKFTAKFATGKLLRPPFWSGFRIVPDAIEFWMAKPFRLHERVLFSRLESGWHGQWLYP